MSKRYIQMLIEKRVPASPSPIDVPASQVRVGEQVFAVLEGVYLYGNPSVKLYEWKYVCAFMFTHPKMIEIILRYATFTPGAPKDMDTTTSRLMPGSVYWIPQVMYENLLDKHYREHPLRRLFKRRNVEKDYERKLAEVGQILGGAICRAIVIIGETQ